MIQFALWYAARGLPVFPLHWAANGSCSCRGPKCTDTAKHPIAPLAPHGAHSATTDEQTIRAWWEQCPQANVGVALPGVGVVDADPRNYEGFDSLALLEQRARESGTPIDATLRIRTGSGGTHLYFRLTDENARYSDALEGLPGLDFKRGAGHYVVGAGSVHASGSAYTVERDAPIAPLPALVSVLAHAREKDDGTGVPLLVDEMPDDAALARVPELVRLFAPALVEKGARHATVRAIGGLLARAGWTDPQIQAVVERLPSDNPGARIRDALRAAERARKGLAAPGFSSLAEHGYSSEFLAAVERTTTNPVTNRIVETIASAAPPPSSFGTLATPPTAHVTLAESDIWPIIDIGAPLEPINYLVPALDIAPGPPTLFGGYGFSGKTAAAQALAVGIAGGRLVFGHFAARAGRVLHIDYEQGERLTRERYQRLILGMGADRNLVLSRLALVSMPRIYVDPLGRNEAEFAKRCAGFDLVIADSLLASAPGLDENSSAARYVLDMWHRVSNATGAVVLIIHHAKKKGENTVDTKEQLRGTSALFDGAASVLMFSADAGQPPRVEQTKARNSGRPHEPFILTISDVKIGENDRAGLIVTPADAQAHAAQVKNQALEDACEKIRAAIKASPTQYTNQHALRAATGLSAERFRLAFSMLTHRNEVFDAGGISLPPTFPGPGTPSAPLPFSASAP